VIKIVLCILAAVVFFVIFVVQGIKAIIKKITKKAVSKKSIITIVLSGVLSVFLPIIGVTHELVGRYMDGVFKNAEEGKKVIGDKLKAQFGIEFEFVGDKVDNNFGYENCISSYFGYIKPKNIPEELKKYDRMFEYWNSYTSIETMKTQAHVAMFDAQLRKEVSKILDDNKIKYDFLEFRGMDRRLDKWSPKDTYETYKNTHDYETWVYIKIDKSVKQEDMPKVILPMVKKLYELLEPTFNPTIFIYAEEYTKKVYDDDLDKFMPVIKKNADLVWLDFSKYKDGVDYWTEDDISQEINSPNEYKIITAWEEAKRTNTFVKTERK